MTEDDSANAFRQAQLEGPLDAMRLYFDVQRWAEEETLRVLLENESSSKTNLPKDPT